MRIAYLFDPLCGWCYGANPVLDRLAGLDGVSLELAPTGLFADAQARPMDAHFADFAWHNDQRIMRLTGQPFSDRYVGNVLHGAGGRFDSGPATLAILAVGLTDPDREFAALKALQKARYVDGLDTCDRAVATQVIENEGFAQAARLVRDAAGDLQAAYDLRVSAARSAMVGHGVNGVPALLVGGDRNGDRRALPSAVLFGSFENLADQLKRAG